MTSENPRTLSVGDVVKATPCVVTIAHVDEWRADGLCSTCQCKHLISTSRYESGQGPWQPVEPTPNIGPLPDTLTYDVAVQDLADVLYDVTPHPLERHIEYAQRVVDALDEAGYEIVEKLDLRFTP